MSIAVLSMSTAGTGVPAAAVSMQPAGPRAAPDELGGAHADGEALVCETSLPPLPLAPPLAVGCFVHLKTAGKVVPFASQKTERAVLKTMVPSQTRQYPYELG